MKKRASKFTKEEGPRPFTGRAAFAVAPSTWTAFCHQCYRRGISPSKMLRRMVVAAMREAYDPLLDPPEDEPRE